MSEHSQNEALLELAQLKDKYEPEVASVLVDVHENKISKEEAVDRINELEAEAREEAARGEKEE